MCLKSSLLRIIRKPKRELKLRRKILLFLAPRSINFLREPIIKFKGIISVLEVWELKRELRERRD